MCLLPKSLNLIGCLGDMKGKFLREKNKKTKQNKHQQQTNKNNLLHGTHKEDEADTHTVVVIPRK